MGEDYFGVPTPGWTFLVLADCVGILFRGNPWLSAPGVYSFTGEILTRPTLEQLCGLYAEAKVAVSQRRTVPSVAAVPPLVLESARVLRLNVEDIYLGSKNFVIESKQSSLHSVVISPLKEK